MAAGVFESMVHDLRELLRLAEGKRAAPPAMIVDGGTTQPAPESGRGAGHDGYKRRNGSKIHMAVDTLGLLLALHLTPADEQERAQVGKLAEEVQAVTMNENLSKFASPIKAIRAISQLKRPKRQALN